MPSHTAILPGLQALRAAAALMVVLHHAELNLLGGFGYPGPERLLVGSAGVDVFFVISGFIMLVSSRRLFAAPGAPRIFLIRRLIRIVPLYWALTTLYALAVLAAPGALARAVSTGTIIASYLFWPYPALDGTMNPLVVVGWTLNFEMFFYALFGCAVMLPRRTAVSVLVVVLALIVAAGAILQPSSPTLAFWSNPVILEFAAGILLGVLYERGLRLPRMISIGLGLAAAAAFLAQIGHHIPIGWPRLALYGLPSLLLVASVTLAARAGRGAGLRALERLGDASYSLYLIHLPILWICRIVAVKLGLAPSGLAAGLAFAAASVAASIVAALFAYALFERPVTRALRALFEGRRTQERGAALPAGPARRG